jgi:hypothetical protein
MSTFETLLIKAILAFLVISMASIWSPLTYHSELIDEDGGRRDRDLTNHTGQSSNVTWLY